jgi:hypothetical protein
MRSTASVAPNCTPTTQTRPTAPERVQRFFDELLDRHHHGR